MTLSLSNILALVWQSLKDPRSFAGDVISVDMPRQSRWEALALLVILGTLLTYVNLQQMLLGSGAAGDPMTAVMEQIIVERPIIVALLQFAILTLLVFFIFWVGRAAGGIGQFGPTILLVAWIELVMVVCRAAQAVLWFASPELAALLGVASLGAFLWLLTQFTAELHGFQNAFVVLMGILATGVGALFGVAFIMSLVGVTMGVM